MRRSPMKAGRSACWTLANADISLAIEKPTGLIRGCTWRKTGVDLFQQTRGGIPGYIGGLRIYDERDDRWYDDWRTPFTVTRAVKRGQAVTIARQYKGAPFTIRLTLRMDADAFHWEVEARKASHGTTGGRGSPPPRASAGADS